jgi:hypothetical protein
MCAAFSFQFVNSEWKEDNEKPDAHRDQCVVVHSAEAQQNRVTCAGILIEVDINPGADFPMAVVYDSTDSLAPHTCVLGPLPSPDWGPLRAFITGRRM